MRRAATRRVRKSNSDRREGETRQEVVVSKHWTIALMIEVVGHCRLEAAFR